MPPTFGMDKISLSYPNLSSSKMGHYMISLRFWTQVSDLNLRSSRNRYVILFISPVLRILTKDHQGITMVR